MGIMSLFRNKLGPYRNPVQISRPRVPNAANAYPFDFDASLQFTRPRTGIDYFPYPPICGAISGFLPMADVFVWNGMFGRQPFGPGTTTYPRNQQWQLAVPGLSKTA